MARRLGVDDVDELQAARVDRARRPQERHAARDDERVRHARRRRRLLPPAAPIREVLDSDGLPAVGDFKPKPSAGRSRTASRPRSTEDPRGEHDLRHRHARRAPADGRPQAGKTGTADDFDGRLVLRLHAPSSRPASGWATRRRRHPDAATSRASAPCPAPTLPVADLARTSWTSRWRTIPPTNGPGAGPALRERVPAALHVQPSPTFRRRRPTRRRRRPRRRRTSRPTTARRRRRPDGPRRSRTRSRPVPPPVEALPADTGDPDG